MGYCNLRDGCQCCASELNACPNWDGPVVASPPTAPTASSEPWLQVLGGVAFPLVRPRADAVNIETMSRVLARIPRFGGHTEGLVYSVAQHSVEGARAILRDTGNRPAASAFLAHDCHEYVLGDWARPVQESLAAIAIELFGDMHAGDVIRRTIAEQKRRLDEVIYPAVGLPWPLSASVKSIVKEYDLRMGRTERDANVATPPKEWDDAYSNAEPVQGCDLSPWFEGWAGSQFMTMARELLPALAVDDDEWLFYVDSMHGAG
jgi:hypothetical protein